MLVRCLKAEPPIELARLKFEAEQRRAAALAAGDGAAHGMAGAGP